MVVLAWQRKVTRARALTRTSCDDEWKAV